MDSQIATRVRYRVLAVFLSLAFITYLDRICMGQAQDDIKRDFKFEEITDADRERFDGEIARFAERNNRPPTEDERQTIGANLSKQLGRERFALVAMAFQLGYVLFEVPGGWMGDRWGVRFVITRIVVWWSLFTALTGRTDAVAQLFAGSTEPTAIAMVWTLFWIRFLFGAGEAGAYPNISRATSRWFPVKERAKVQGMVWLASRWGGGLAAVIYTQVLLLFGLIGGNWRWVFYSFGALGIVWSVWFWWWYRNRPEEMPGVNQAECDLIRGGADQKGSIYDDHSHANVPWLKLYTSPNLLAMYVAAFCSSFCWYFHSSQLKPYLQETFDAKQGQIDFALTATLMGGGVFCILGGLLSTTILARTGNLRWARALPGLIAFLGAAACLLSVPACNQTKNATAAILLITLCYTVQDLHMAVLWSLTGDIGGRVAGTLAGNLNMLGNVGGLLGLALVPKVIQIGSVDGAANWNNVFWMNGVVYLIGAAMWLRINANEKLLGPGDLAPKPAEAK